MPKLSRRDFLKLSALTPAAFLPRWRALRPRQAAPPRPNILMVLCDALSARNLSLYGYPRRTTPNLERLAARATVYHNHHAAGKFTTPSTASLFSGVYPSDHRALQLMARLGPDYAGRSLLHALNPAYRTWAYTHNNYVEIFFDQFAADLDEWVKTQELCLGSLNLSERFLAPDYFLANQAEILSLWRVGAPSGSAFLEPLAKLRQRWLERRLNRQYAAQFPRGLPNATVTFFTLEAVVDWTVRQAQAGAPPYFGYVHVLPPHAPYVTRSEFIDAFQDDYHPPAKPPYTFAETDEGELERQRRLYDEAILYCDAEFGRLFAGLEQAGALDNTLVIFTSDHGEMFERGVLGHEGPAMYEPVLHIPLLVWQPGQTSRRDVHTLTSTVDWFPTLLTLAGLPVPAGLPGLPLPGLKAGASSETAVSPETAERVIFSVEARRSSRVGPLNIATLAAYQGRFKLIEHRGYSKLKKSFELYDLENDPEEQTNLAGERSQVVERLKGAIKRQIDRD